MLVDSFAVLFKSVLNFNSSKVLLNMGVNL